jgi:DNA-directed RNA polymerase I, II, and III subunit RPABC2
MASKKKDEDGPISDPEDEDDDLGSESSSIVDDDDDDEEVDDEDKEDDDKSDEGSDNEYKEESAEGGKLSHMSKQRLHTNTEADEDNSDGDEDEDVDDEDNYLQKLDEDTRQNIVDTYYPEFKALNSDEVDILTRVVRNEAGIIVDPLHRTLPFVTKYERARILGERAKQINAGASPFVPVADDILDGYLIATEEFQAKKIPFIVKRPLPNGGCEYWKLADLDILSN